MIYQPCDLTDIQQINLYVFGEPFDNWTYFKWRFAIHNKPIKIERSAVYDFPNHTSYLRLARFSDGKPRDYFIYPTIT